MYKLMLVDDEYMILKGLQQILPWEKLGFQIVHTARNAKDALTYLSSHEIDLLVTDITMPEMSGIEMVEAAQNLGHCFSTIILTGYEEFEYAKKSLQLGVKNYLLKPVDKQELLATVKEMKIDLLNQSHLKEQQQVYMENHLIRWLHDELNEEEFQKISESYGLIEGIPYTVLQVEGETETLQEVMTYLNQHGQKLLVNNWLFSEKKLVWIYQGTNKELKKQVKIFERDMPLHDELLIGETVAEWVDLYESFEKVKQLTALKKFYPELLPSFPEAEMKANRETELSFLSFNKALMIGDSKTIKQELSQIFNHMATDYYDPDDARYVAFFLFADISRKYPQGTKKIYDEVIHTIRESHTITELQTLLETILLRVKEQPEEKPFSEIVQKVVDLVKKEYQTDLNLKTVADEMHLNVVYVGQLFKKETHASFSQYLNQVRIRKAQQLLLYTHQAINEIGEEVGYNNTNYFSKMFKKLNGLTPKEFREKYYGDYSILIDNEEREGFL